MTKARKSKTSIYQDMMCDMKRAHEGRVATVHALIASIPEGVEFSPDFVRCLAIVVAGYLCGSFTVGDVFSDDPKARD